MAENDEKPRPAEILAVEGSGNPATRGGRARRDAEAAKGDSGIALAMRAGSEFISAIIVGVGVGWALDRLLGTNPAFLIVFFYAGGRGRRLERHPRHFAQRRGLKARFELVSYGCGG